MKATTSEKKYVLWGGEEIVQIIAALLRRASAHLESFNSNEETEETNEQIEEHSKWITIAIYLLHATCECLIWKSDIGIASEQFLQILFSICKYIKGNEVEEQV